MTILIHFNLQNTKGRLLHCFDASVMCVYLFLHVSLLNFNLITLSPSCPHYSQFTIPKSLMVLWTLIICPFGLCCSRLLLNWYLRPGDFFGLWIASVDHFQFWFIVAVWKVSEHHGFVEGQNNVLCFSVNTHLAMTVILLAFLAKAEY